MNKLIEIEEQEQLKSESERLKKLTESIIQTHKKKYEQEIVRTDINNILEEHRQYIEAIEADNYTKSILNDFQTWRLLNR